MSANQKQRLREIRIRLNEYNKHCNDPYDLDLREISAVHKLENNAPQDIEFLLEEIERLKAQILLLVVL